jgi:hypothetical protein
VIRRAPAVPLSPTRLPVICAVNRPRLKNPITSTIPAITLSSGGRRLSNRSNSAEAFTEFDFTAADIFTLRSGLRSRCAIEETINDDLWDNETEAAVGDSRIISTTTRTR